jgi:glycosyltransferase involved in cell wall biosynthesis
VERKLNILFLSSWYPNRCKPELGNFVQRFAEAIALNCNVAALHVCSDERCKRTFELEAKQINSVLTVNVYYKKVVHRIPVLSQLQKIQRYVRAHLIGLAHLKKTFPKIDLVHHNGIYPAGIIALYLKKFSKIPYVVSEHWTGFLSSKAEKLSRAQLQLSRMVAKNANFILPVSEDLASAMKARGVKGRYHVIYNVVDTKLFKPDAARTINTKKKLIHVSSLHDPHKNISGMLRALSLLASKRTDFEMLFIGDMHQKKYEELARSLALENVRFEGIKPIHEIAAEMRKADAFVMFSNYENLPCVIIEALACGIPVLSSDVGGINEHITADRGILVTAGDEKKLADSLSLLLDKLQNQEYNTEQIREYAASNFSYQAISKSCNAIYRKILND